MLDALPRLADRLSAAVGWLCARLVVGMVAAGALAAVLRYLAPVLGITPALNALGDVQWMLFSAVFLLGAAWALAEDAHVRVDVIYGGRPPRTRAAIDLAGTVLLLLPFCALLAWASWPAVVDSVVLREGALDAGGLVRWPVKLLLPVGLGLLALQGVAQGLRAVATLRTP
ncbi:TRAP transporter small permease subunit [Rubrivirga sp. IMCC45206]|uniref:TRAP transporter small permease subunit n=1 Tax=Rubrivirga sp. IMCC45206 TaxID=3391614 RepID=UPI00398FFF70